MEDTKTKAKLEVLQKLIAMMDESETGRLKSKSPRFK